MVIGSHILVYSSAPEKDRAFLTNVLHFKSVDAGHGWLIFKLPPAELAVHPVDEEFGDATAHAMLDAHVYLMCDDLEKTMKDLAAQGVQRGDVGRERWGMRLTRRLPRGGPR